MSENVEEKVVVITGASSGLGEATARLLSEQGAIVVLGARRTDRLKSLADEIARALAAKQLHCRPMSYTGIKSRSWSTRLSRNSVVSM